MGKLSYIKIGDGKNNNSILVSPVYTYNLFTCAYFSSGGGGGGGGNDAYYTI